MKAFLMHSDRDFDPGQLLARREKELRYNKDDGDANLNLQQVLPWNGDALTQDLGLNVLFNAMAQGDRYLFEVAKVAALSSLTDPVAIRYRQRALADSLKNAQIIEAMYRIAIDAIEGEKKGYWSFFTRYPSGILHRAVDVLQMFVGALKRLRDVADQHADKFESEAFSRLFAMLREELGDEYFATIDEHLRRLKFRHGILISARLGKGSKGDGYVLRKPHEDARNWLTRMLADKPVSYSYALHPRDEAGARALSELSDKGVNLVANALAQSTDHILSFFQMLRTELAFYVGCINLYSRLSGMGEPICFPVAAPVGERKLSFSGLYDPSLALSLGRKVVGNDLDADRMDLLIITGANTGGKSTFLRSVGLAQLMLQAGMFVAADAFSSAVCAGLCTHYKREEDTAMESGKWDEELKRVSEIIGRIGSNTMLLFNESFASTDEREGSEIAEQIVAALLERGVKVLFVTHLYEFAHRFHRRHVDGALFLRAERRPDGARTYRLVDGEPLQTSYGKDLYDSVFGSARPRRLSDSATGARLQRRGRSTLIQG